MATKNLTKAEFEDLAEAQGITLIDFWAEWCVPCHMFAPTFEKVSEKHPDITFAKVDTGSSWARGGTGHQLDPHDHGDP